MASENTSGAILQNFITWIIKENKFMSLQVAIIGCGMIGCEHIERIQNRIRNAKVVAVCDVFEEGA